MTAQPKVLVATDLSARCDRPVDRAFLLADQVDGSVLLTHVPAESSLPREEEDQLRAFIRRDLGERANQAEVIIAYGSVPSTIARVAAEREALVILTGVGRMNDLRDYFLGTAVDYLVRQAPVPVLVVKQRARVPYERILAATDFSPGAAKAVEAAAAMFPTARIRMVHAYHPAYEGILDRNETAAFIGEEAREEMEGFVQALPDWLKERLETSIEEGELATVLGGLLRDWSGDLLVVGSHGRGGFAHATIGSRAAELLGCEPVDILVVR